MTYPRFHEHRSGHAKMVDMQLKGSACRIKKCAFDLLSIGNDLTNDDRSWELMGRDLRLKSTFLYCDLNQMISRSPRDQKRALTELANKLFCSIEELDHAVKIRSLALTQDRYNEAAVILQEVMALAP
ncbi:photosynthetic NDH subunit of lumenal location 3, chloroplastic-like isoform X1 [Pyrus x bretschneideri]|uniref:photosynthetic NDH subunit of lumenal location 3, chloroplastic-like isoform X1 n=2 Tax=Pyrus x bretschneideri TaxID=225117 RepID=UPI0005109690|nr:photosynthetic NDH subunit of lumenal location 3, chloroplastic-like isoform X1 [Pyrus x bretschneideri]